MPRTRTRSPAAGEHIAVPSPDAINAQDTRIMLQMLLSEARRYHAVARRGSRRCPTFVSRPAREVDPLAPVPRDTPRFTFASRLDETVDGDSPGPLLGTRRDDDEETPSRDYACHPRANSPGGDSVTTDASSDDGYCAWAELQARIEEAWYSAEDTPALTRYHRLKQFLTWMFLWDASRDWEEFEEVTSDTSLHWIRQRHLERLGRLRPGQLFLPPQ